MRLKLIKTRDFLKKKSEDERQLIQARIDSDLLALVDSQIERDKKSGLDVDRTKLIEACLKKYLQESKN
jgi:hypothetical protein